MQCLFVLKDAYTPCIKMSKKKLLWRNVSPGDVTLILRSLKLLVFKLKP